MIRRTEIFLKKILKTYEIIDANWIICDYMKILSIFFGEKNEIASNSTRLVSSDNEPMIEERREDADDEATKLV